MWKSKDNEPCIKSMLTKGINNIVVRIILHSHCYSNIDLLNKIFSKLRSAIFYIEIDRCVPIKSANTIMCSLYITKIASHKSRAKFLLHP